MVRYANDLGRAPRLPSQAQALLELQMRRGPQTAGASRIGGERLHRFADIPSVAAFLQARWLHGRKTGALVVELARGAGERESRWAHPSCGPVQAGVDAAGASSGDADGDHSAFRAEIAALRAGVAEPRATIAALHTKARAGAVCGAIRPHFAPSGERARLSMSADVSPSAPSWPLHA